MDKIFSKRLVLRRIEYDDLPVIAYWSQSQEAHGRFLTKSNFSLNECRIKFNNNYFWNADSRIYVIGIKNGALIGTIHFWIAANDKSCAFIQIKIAVPEFRNKGYGTEAQKALINYLFSVRDFVTVEMFTDIDNYPEQKCLTKLGFDLAETLDYYDNNVKRTGNRYCLTKEKYQVLPIYKYHYE